MEPFLFYYYGYYIQFICSTTCIVLWFYNFNLFMYKGENEMKKYILGGVITLLINYCVGSTYIIYKQFQKGRKKDVGIN